MAGFIPNLEDAEAIKMPKLKSIKDNLDKIRNKQDNHVKIDFDDIPDILI